MDYVSDCCLGDYKLKRFYNRDGSEAENVALMPGQKEAVCLECFNDCSVIRKPKN